MRPGDLFRPKVALALGGGGARGFGHLGVLALLEREGIRPDMIVGTSIGALVGALFCLEGSSLGAHNAVSSFVSSPDFEQKYFQRLKELTAPPNKKDGIFRKIGRFFNLGKFALTTATKESFVPRKSFGRNIDNLMGDARLEQLSPRLAIVAADLQSGREVVLTEGRLNEAVKASIAIAGIFPSTPLDGKTLVDGGYVNQVPVEVAFRLGADVVIAVDVAQEIPAIDDCRITGGASRLRATMIQAETARRLQLRFADMVITPKIENLHWTDFDKVSEFAEIGFREAENALGGIKKALRRAALMKPFWTIFGRRWKIDLRKEGTGGR